MNYPLKIKLISPRMSLRPMDSTFKRRMSPSLSLVIIASLTPPEHHVYIEDENIKPVNFNDTPDLVGINVNVDTAHRAIQIAQKYRTKGIRVVFGGIHASANAREMLEHCDAVCIGEAEVTWKVLLKDLQNNNLRKTYTNTQPVHLSHYPLPEWKFIDKKKYLYNNIIITSFDYSKYNTSHVVFQPRHISPEALKKGYLKIYRKFYSVKNIIKRLPDNKNIRLPYLLFNFGYRKFGKMTSLAGKIGLMNKIAQLCRRLSYGIE